MTYREIFLAAFPEAQLDGDGATPIACRNDVFGRAPRCPYDPDYADAVPLREGACRDCWAETGEEPGCWPEMMRTAAEAFLRAERAMCDRAPTCAECPLGKCAAPYTLDDAQIARIVAAVASDDERHGGSGI